MSTTQAIAMTNSQYTLDSLRVVQGGATATNPSFAAESVLGQWNDAGSMLNSGYQLQGGLITELESTGGVSSTTTTSVPSTTTTPILTTTTSIKPTTSIPTTTTSAPVTTSIKTTTSVATTTSLPIQHPPTINGTPTTKAIPGLSYSFVPTASDADGDALSFSIKNMPPWASFNTTTGALTGTPPAKDAIYGNIVISVTAGSDTVALPIFEISVANTANPTVTITYPTDGSTFNAENSLSALSGSITDSSGVGILKVELQISDGTLYLVGENGSSQGLVPDSSSWVLAKTSNAWKTWYFVTSNTLWQSGKTYTITARVTDKAEKIATTTSKFTYTDKSVIFGTILDAHGKPIQDVTIRFADDKKRTSTIVSDPDGKYQWIVPNSGWSGTITPTKPGYTFTPAEISTPSITTNQLNSNFIATAVESEQDARAIIVAGGDLEDFLWPATKNVASFAYTVLRKKGISKQNIRYLGMDVNQDLDNDKVSDSDGLATSSALQDAIANWAGGYVNSKKPLILYMVDHGLPGQFLITKPRHGQADILTSAKLQEWLNALQTKTGAKVILIMDSCYSGSFVHDLIPPKGMSRIVITSTDTKELAYFASDGDQSFSSFFWKYILMGRNLRDSFAASVQASRAASGNQQNPIMDADFDGVYSTTKDTVLVSTTYLGTPFFTAAVFPEITDSSPDSYMDEKGPGLTLWVQLMQDASKMNRVWGVVVPPGINDSQEPITDLPILALKFNEAAKRYEATFDSTLSGFKGSGQYVISFYAQANDGERWISLPKSVTIQVGKDAFESDNTSSQASIIIINDPLPQRHNTHLPNDADWVKFYALKNVTYAIEAINLGQNADLVLELYDTDGATQITKAVNDQGPGVEEKITFTPTKDGVYFVKARQFGDNIAGADTGYDLKVYRPYGPIMTPFVAQLTNPDKTPLANALIQTAGNETAITDSQGRFTLMTPTSNTTVDLTINGMQSAATGVQVNLSSKTLMLTVTSTQGSIGISPIANQTVKSTQSSIEVPFTVLNRESATAALIFSAKSLNNDLVPDANIQVVADGTPSKLIITLVASKTGSSVITLTMKDGAKSLTSNFTLTVESASAVLDVDQSGTVDATDGVLLLRKLNGASTIDTGVVLPTGQTNSTVMTSINLIATKLDVDQSGSVDATDGVLILRKLNGASTIDTGVVLPIGQNNASVITAIDAIAK
ncbi:MAG: pre-peptidase C-terminal domain-containing protein [Magnetococcus sp. YQC-5]